MIQATLWHVIRSVGAALILLPAAAQAGVEGQAGTAQTPAAQDRATLYRVFLRDGGVLVSYGDFAHISDRVVLSLPVGGTETNPVLHLVSIPETEVDWDRTNAYAQTARARRYAESRGEEDFAKLTRDVAGLLYQAGLVEDAGKRLALAEAARRQLAEWPKQHYNYRAEEMQHMTAWLDQVVSELRVAAGVSRFDLTLVAGSPSMLPVVQLLPPPEFRERTESALLAATKTPDPAERVSLLRAVVASLQSAGSESWAAALHAQVSSQLAVELKTDRAYADLTRRTVSRAATLAERADVRGLERLVRRTMDEDRKLEGARPAEMGALLATLDSKLDAARRLRLARDAWELRKAGILGYWQEVRQGLDRLLGLRQWLIDVRQLAGPSPDALRRVAYEAEWAGHAFAKVQPPAEMSNAHSTLASSCTMAVRAAKTRLDALRSGRMETAWEASSAAAGALMLLDTAIADLRRVTRQPPPPGVVR